MRIGNIETPLIAGFAPMAGVSDMPLRSLCFRMGAGWAVTEMLSAKGFLYAPKDTRPIIEHLTKGAGEGITGLQLFGHEPSVMAEAAKGLRDSGFEFIDINMGCPAKKIVSNGDGSALMKRPDVAGEIISRVVKAVDIPVTVKIRTGWDEWHINCVEMAKIAQDAGAAAITLHARTREMFYVGKADRSFITDVVNAVKIPVIGNGDVTCAKDAVDMMKETGCAGVAIARAARGNPWIFRDIACYIEGKEPPRVTFRERAQTAAEHMQMEIELRGERSAVMNMRKHIAWYLTGERDAAKMRSEIMKMETSDKVLAALDRIAGGEGL